MSHNRTSESAIDSSKKSNTIKNLVPIPAMLIVGDLDPHCRDNLVNYKSYIEKKDSCQEYLFTSREKDWPIRYQLHL